MRVGRRRGLFELTAEGYSSKIIAFFLLEFVPFVVSLLAAIIRGLSGAFGVAGENPLSPLHF